MDSYRRILDSQIQKFLSSINKAVDDNYKHKNRTGYLVYFPESYSEYENEHYDFILNLCIIDYLFSGIIPRWLRISGFKCFVPIDSGKRKYAYSGVSPNIFYDSFPFAFVIERNNQRIAYRYHDVDDIHEEIVSKYAQKYGINKIIVIDWTYTNALISKKTCWLNNAYLRGLISYTTLFGFLHSFFKNDLCETYINSTREAVIQALRLIGYQTISNLSLKHLSNFKDDITKNLFEFDIANAKYIMFDNNGNFTNQVMECLDPDDYEIIHQRCVKDKLIYVFNGSSDFARCFMTSEHLYELFKNDNQNFYDYSAIVSGYFKSVELLLKEAMDATFTHTYHENLWIKMDSRKWKRINEENKRKNENNVPQVRFIFSLRRYFSLEMGSLIWFLYDNQNDWYIEKSRHSIHNCLLNYSNGCRNEHFHKDVIKDMKTVEAIRNNTIICLLSLLGGYKFYNNPIEDLNRLRGVDNGYNRFYRTLKEIPDSIRFFVLKFEAQEIKAVRLYDQDDTEYDEFGNVITGIKFAIVDSFEIDDDYEHFISQIEEKNKLTIAKDNVPLKIWWYSERKFKGENLHKIEW